MSAVMRRGSRRRATTSRVAGNAVLRGWCPLVKGRVLSVGSGADRDKEGKRYRDYFSAASSYETSDVGTGCDLVLDVQAMPTVADGAYDGVFCHSVLEHVTDPCGAVRECARILSTGGVFILAVPFNYQIHRAPQDYWRFTEHGLRMMLGWASLEVKELLGVDGDPKHPAMYIARARKP